MRVGRERRPQPGGGLAVGRQRRLLSGIPAAEQLRQLPVGFPRRADGGGEAGSRRHCAYSVFQTDVGTKMVTFYFSTFSCSVTVYLRSFYSVFIETALFLPC